jgi:hypothetical protein
MEPVSRKFGEKSGGNIRRLALAAVPALQFQLHLVDSIAPALSPSRIRCLRGGLFWKALKEPIKSKSKMNSGIKILKKPWITV